MTDKLGANDTQGILLSLGFTAGFLLPFVLSVAVPPHSSKDERKADRIAYQKCGPDGTVDWDDNPEFPPPHCNRDGWNGKRYVQPKERRK